MIVIATGELRPPQLDGRARDGPWAPNFASGYTPPFFAAEEEAEEEESKR